MRVTDDFRTKWTAAALVVAGGYLWAWWQTPVDPGGEESVIEPMLIVSTMALPPGLAIAALSARFAWRNRALTRIAWIAVVAYGAWTSMWTGVMAIWSGRLFYCGDPGMPSCWTDWPPRLAVVPVAALTLGACVLLEARLRERWEAPSAPS